MLLPTSNSHLSYTPSISSVPNTFLTSLGDLGEEDCGKPLLDVRLSGEELLHQLKNKIKTRYPEIKQVGNDVIRLLNGKVF